MKGYGKNSKNSGTGYATSYHSKKEQTVANLFSDKDYIAYRLSDNNLILKFGTRPEGGRHIGVNSGDTIPIYY